MRHTLIKLVSSLLIFAFSRNIAQSGLTVAEGEARHDFGVVARNQPLKYVLKIKNDGPAAGKAGTGTSPLRSA
jgi:hypothetical protein